MSRGKKCLFLTPESHLSRLKCLLLPFAYSMPVDKMFMNIFAQRAHRAGDILCGSPAWFAHFLSGDNPEGQL